MRMPWQCARLTALGDEITGRRIARAGLLLLAVTAMSTVGRADDWPRWLGPNGDSEWRETGILRAFPETGPDVRWRIPVSPGYSGPAVADGRVYLMDRLTDKDEQGQDKVTDDGSIVGRERVLCLAAADGGTVWEHAYACDYKISYPSGPRTTPVVDQGRLYTLGAMGDVICFDAANGQVAWSKSLRQDYSPEPPAWGWSAHPYVDGERLICRVGGEGSSVVAFDKRTGRELWRSMTSKEIGYAPPVMCEAAGRRQLIIWDDVSVNGLDPASGKVFWSLPYPPGGNPMRPAVPIATPRATGDLVFVSDFYDGPLMLKLTADQPGASVLWGARPNDPRHAHGLYCLMSPPFIHEQHVYGVSGSGELRCLSAATGDKLWESLAVTGPRKALFATTFLVRNGDAFFLFNDQGDLIIARLSPERYEELDRAHLLDPSQFARGRDVVWSHPAFANRSIYARNDKELVCVSLVAEEAKERS